MKTISLDFANQEEFLFAIKNLAESQYHLAESIEENGNQPSKTDALKTVSNIISQMVDQLAEQEMERQIKSIVEE